jgi:hypothetical protein
MCFGSLKAMYFIKDIPSGTNPFAYSMQILGCVDPGQGHSFRPDFHALSGRTSGDIP